MPKKWERPNDSVPNGEWNPHSHLAVRYGDIYFLCGLLFLQETKLDGKQGKTEGFPYPLAPPNSWGKITSPSMLNKNGNGQMILFLTAQWNPHSHLAARYWDIYFLCGLLVLQETKLEGKGERTAGFPYHLATPDCWRKSTFPSMINKNDNGQIILFLTGQWNPHPRLAVRYGDIHFLCGRLFLTETKFEGKQGRTAGFPYHLAPPNSWRKITSPSMLKKMGTAKWFCS